MSMVSHQLSNYLDFELPLLSQPMRVQHVPEAQGLAAHEDLLAIVDDTRRCVVYEHRTQTKLWNTTDRYFDVLLFWDDRLWGIHSLEDMGTSLLEFDPRTGAVLAEFPLGGTDRYDAWYLPQLFHTEAFLWCSVQVGSQIGLFRVSKKTHLLEELFRRDAYITGRESYACLISSTLVFEHTNEQLVAIDPNTRTPVWMRAVQGDKAVLLSPDGSCLVGTDSEQVFCIDAATGTLRWTRSTKENGYVRAVHPEVCIVNRRETIFDALSLKDGSPLWTQQALDARYAIATKNSVLLYGEELQCIDVRTGTPREALRCSRLFVEVLPHQETLFAVTYFPEHAEFEVRPSSFVAPCEEPINVENFSKEEAIEFFVALLGMPPAPASEANEKVRAICEHIANPQERWEQLVNEGLLPASWLDDPTRRFHERTPLVREPIHSFPHTIELIEMLLADFRHTQQAEALAREVHHRWLRLCGYPESEAVLIWMERNHAGPYLHLTSHTQFVFRRFTSASFSAVEKLLMEAKAFGLPALTEPNAQACVRLWLWKHAREKHLSLVPVDQQQHGCTLFSSLPDPIAPLLSLRELGIELVRIDQAAMFLCGWTRREGVRHPPLIANPDEIPF